MRNAKELVSLPYSSLDLSSAQFPTFRIFAQPPERQVGFGTNLAARMASRQKNPRIACNRVLRTSESKTIYRPVSRDTFSSELTRRGKGQRTQDAPTEKSCAVDRLLGFAGVLERKALSFGDSVPPVDVRAKEHICLASSEDNSRVVIARQRLDACATKTREQVRRARAEARRAVRARLCLLNRWPP